jgi:hypothetical protein
MRRQEEQPIQYRPDKGTKDELSKWRDSPHGEYLKYLWGKREDIRNSNIIYLDIEFFSGPPQDPRLKVAIYHETCPPTGKRKHNIVWYHDISSIERCIRALNRADYLVAYNPRALDFPSLEKYGLDQRDVLLKTIDLDEFVFKALSINGTASLSEVSMLNGGPGKIQRRDSSPSEYQRQCDRDVKALRVLFKRILEGRFKCSKYGNLDLDQLFSPPRPPVTKESSRESEVEWAYGRIEILPRLGLIPPLYFRYQRHTISRGNVGASH